MSGGWVRYDNIVGVLPEDDMIGRVAAKGDGVVTYESAHLEDGSSEVIVPEDHVNIHRHPRTILEVQRILLAHLAELRENLTQALSKRDAGYGDYRTSSDKGSSDSSAGG